VQDAAEALYDYVVQKDSLGLGDKKMVTRLYAVGRQQLER
jgi:hypothetical protein